MSVVDWSGAGGHPLCVDTHAGVAHSAHLFEAFGVPTTCAGVTA